MKLFLFFFLFSILSSCESKIKSKIDDKNKKDKKILMKINSEPSIKIKK